VFNLRDATLIPTLGIGCLTELVESLHSRAEQLGPGPFASADDPSESWQEAYGYAAEMLSKVGSMPGATGDLRGRLHTILERWATLGIEKAVRAARAIRAQQ
jgi:hypothetical protein